MAAFSFSGLSGGSHDRDWHRDHRCAACGCATAHQRSWKHNSQHFLPDEPIPFDWNLDRSIWTPFDTDSDAVFFGIWIDVEVRRILTHAEGDVTLTECEDEQRYDLELAALCAFHPPGPAFSTLSDGVLTRYYQDRRELFIDPELCPPSALDLEVEPAATTDEEP